MSAKPPRRSFLVAVSALLVIFSSSLQPSVPGAPGGVPAPPTPDELEILRQLTEWVEAPPPESDLLDLIRNRPESFELLRSYPPETARREVVAGLPFGDHIAVAADRWRLDALLLAALVEVESSFCPAATSPRGAVGLAQVLPTTAEIFGVSDLTDPATNLDVAGRYLAGLLERFEGDLGLVLAAYNAGPTNVARYGDVPPFRETQRYLDRVLARYLEHQQEAWGISGAKALLLLN